MAEESWYWRSISKDTFVFRIVSRIETILKEVVLFKGKSLGYGI